MKLVYDKWLFPRSKFTLNGMKRNINLMNNKIFKFQINRRLVKSHMRNINLLQISCYNCSSKALLYKIKESEL